MAFSWVKQGSHGAHLGICWENISPTTGLLNSECPNVGSYPWSLSCIACLRNHGGLLSDIYIQHLTIVFSFSYLVRAIFPQMPFLLPHCPIHWTLHTAARLIRQNERQTLCFPMFLMSQSESLAFTRRCDPVPSCPLTSITITFSSPLQTPVSLFFQCSRQLSFQRPSLGVTLVWTLVNCCRFPGDCLTSPVPKQPIRKAASDHIKDQSTLSRFISHLTQFLPCAYPADIHLLAHTLFSFPNRACAP